MLSLPKPSPDFERFRKVLLRQGEPDRMPFVELFHDQEIMDAILPMLPGDDGTDERLREVRRRVRFWHQLGYDYVSIWTNCPLPTSWQESSDTAQLSRTNRSWTDESRGAISSREDFERYPWPGSDWAPDMSAFEYTAQSLPEGMKIIGYTCGVLEYAIWSMGYVGFSMALMDDPELIDNIFQQVGRVLFKVYEAMAQMDAVGALWLADDMGFKHSTMVSPEVLRRYVFPWHKKIADLAHKAGKPYLLHSCGYLEEIMPDLVDDIGLDARHSFEDVIMPAVEAKRRWGHRVAILGGVDMDVLCRADVDTVRRYTRTVLQDCMPGGGYALGSGNSISNYIPIENYLAMLETGRDYGIY